MYKFRIVTLLLLLTVFLCGCSTQYSQFPSRAQSGLLDLEQYQLTDRIVPLDGEWEFYWNQLLEPAKISQGELSAMVTFPSSWNKYQLDGEKVSGFGYATYRLRFQTTQEAILALKIPKVRTAYTLWMNGEEIADAGVVGVSNDTMTPQYKPQIVSFQSQTGENEIVIQMSNFHMQSGGLLSSILLGSEEALLALRYQGLAFELFICGALGMMGIYHLALFLFRRKDKSALFFGIFGILVAIRTLFIGESFAFFAFPELSFVIARKMQTLTYYLGTPIIFLFFREMFPTFFHEKIARITLLVGGIYTVTVIVTPVRIYTAFNSIFQIGSIFLMGYIFLALIRVVRDREKNSALIFLGGLSLLVTGLMDIITLSPWISNGWPALLKELIKGEGNSSTGQLIFTILYSLLIAKKFTDSLEYKTVMSEKLTEINSQLDELVLQRTEALTEANKQVEFQNLKLAQVNEELQRLSLKDPLTGLWNRRHYSKSVNLEWQRCIELQKSISLLFIDVDFFKNYNDYYGHSAGDDCLIKIAEVLKNTLEHPSDMAVRYGGEEFIVLLKETEREEALRTVGKILDEIASCKIPHERSAISDTITVSIGVATVLPDYKSDPEYLLKAADQALYRAKNAGRNQICSADY